jgi:spore germination protein YaaH
MYVIEDTDMTGLTMHVNPNPNLIEPIAQAILEAETTLNEHSSNMVDLVEAMLSYGFDDTLVLFKFEAELKLYNYWRDKYHALTGRYHAQTTIDPETQVI